MFQLDPNHYRLKDHVSIDCVDKFKCKGKYTITRDNLSDIIHLAPHRIAQKIAKLHNITRKHNISLLELRGLFRNHKCVNCDRYISVIETKLQKINTLAIFKQSPPTDLEPPSNFPPEPPSETLCEEIMRDFCHEFDASSIIERGCAVCAQLTPINQLSKLKAISNHLKLLEVSGVASKERKTPKDLRMDIPGPVLAPGCDEVCHSCRQCLRQGNVPSMALAQNLWIGEVPDELKTLTFIEKLMVSRVRHNSCYATVASGVKKLRCNIISFETNLPKVYSMLPPPASDMD
jgi:hypothetical protein